jgi:hypothetical protein
VSVIASAITLIARITAHDAHHDSIRGLSHLGGEAVSVPTAPSTNANDLDASGRGRGDIDVAIDIPDVHLLAGGESALPAKITTAITVLRASDDRCAHQCQDDGRSVAHRG